MRQTISKADTDWFLQKRAADLRDVAKGESVAQSYTRNFVGYGPKQPPQDELGASVFQKAQSMFHPGGRPVTTTPSARYPDPVTIPNPMAAFEVLVAEAMRQNPNLTRMQAQDKTMLSEKGAAAWQKAKDWRPAA